MKLKFYHCPICGNIFIAVADSNVVPDCCGHQMEILTPGTNEGEFVEKHVPVIRQCGRFLAEIKVGSKEHPMDGNHRIDFICVQMKDRFLVKYLKPGEEPKAIVATKEPIEAVYAYCNIHGLWMAEVKSACAVKGLCCRR